MYLLFVLASGLKEIASFLRNIAKFRKLGGLLFSKTIAPMAFYLQGAGAAATFGGRLLKLGSN